MNYYDLLNKKYHFKYYILFIIVVFIIIIIYIGNKSTTDIYKTIGYVSDNRLVINVPLEYYDTLNKLVYIKIDEENYYL